MELKKLIFSAAAVAFLASCQKDVNVESFNTSSLSLKTSIQSLSRAGITATSFADNTSIGVYINAGNLGADYNVAEDGPATTNVKYTVLSNTWSSDKPISLSSVVGTVRVYYPYSESNASNDGTNIPVTINENQGSGQSDGTEDVSEQSDYMYATPVPGISNKQPQAILTMNHALSMVTIKFIQASEGSEYTGPGNVTKISIKNSDGKDKIKAGSGTMNIDNGEITISTRSENGIYVTPTETSLIDKSSAEVLPRLLINPCELASEDAVIEIILDAQKYIIPIPAITYAAGNNYTYTLTTKGTGLTISQVSINQWTEQEGGSADVATPVE